MDSSSFHVLQLFHQGSYRAAIAAYGALEQPDAQLTLYAARSHLALSPPDSQSALALLGRLPATSDSRAVSSLAKYLSGATDNAVDELQEILTDLGEGGLEEGSDGRMVRSIVATAWLLEGEHMRDEAVEILREGIELGQDEECLAILSHLHMSLNNPAGSLSLLQSPSVTAFTSDSLLSQLLLARTHLLLGPKQKYQDAYYVFEEVKGMQGGRSEAVLNGVGVAEGALGRWDEAGRDVDEAVELNPVDPTALANCVALALHTGKNRDFAQGILANLKAAAPTYPLALDLAEKELAFDVAASKFTVKASA